MTVLITPSHSFLQYDGAPKLILRSTTFLKEFLLSLNQRNGPRLNLWTSIPSIGIVTDLNPLRRLLSTRSAPVSVSLSTSTFNLFFLYKLTRLLSRDGRREKKGSYKSSGREEERDGRRCHGDGFKQAFSKKEIVAQKRSCTQEAEGFDGARHWSNGGGTKMVTPAKQGGGKGLVVPPSSSQKKPPVLLHEDPKYALEKLSSIIGNEDYEDLRNHSTEAMGETSLFSIAQVRVRHNLACGWYKLAEEELFELRNWKVVTEQKFKIVEWARDEFQKMTEELKKVLEDKENDLRHAKETAVLEYRDSNALLSKFGVSYNDGFDDALCQAKALYPRLDFSPVNITIPEATSVHPEQSDDTNELFGEEVPVSVAPEVPTVEREEARQAKNSIGPDA